MERDETAGKPFLLQVCGWDVSVWRGVHFLEACPPHFKFQGLPKADQIRVVPLRGHAPIIPIPRNITLGYNDILIFYCSIVPLSLSPSSFSLPLPSLCPSLSFPLSLPSPSLRLITSYRTFFMFASSESEADKWVDILDWKLVRPIMNNSLGVC